MRPLAILLASALIGGILLGCGEKTETTNSIAPTSTGESFGGSSKEIAGPAAKGAYETDDGDEDGDDGPKPTASSQDDRRVLARYHKAGKGEARAITDLVKSYYSASIDRDGERACSLLDSELVAGMAPGQGGSAKEARERCPIALSRLLAQQHEHLVTEDPATMAVVGVYVRHDLGLVLLGFKASLESSLLIAREGRAWRIDALFDSALT